MRRELGYPMMVTPFSQLVGIQAVLNVVTGERYSVVPDEVVQYAAGYYGQTPAPIEPGTLDRIMAAPRAAEIFANPPEQPTEDELRARYGTTDDDELVLKALVPQFDLDAMHAAGPTKRDYPLAESRGPAGPAARLSDHLALRPRRDRVDGRGAAQAECLTARTQPRRSAPP